jgi:hypothetical protein
MSFSALEHLVWHHCTEQTRDGFLWKNTLSITNNKERKLTEESLTTGFQGLSTQASAWWFVTVLSHFVSLRRCSIPLTSVLPSGMFRLASRDSSISMAMGYGMDCRRSIPARGKEIFSSP